MTVFDLHIHTLPRSVDSFLSLEELVDEAKRIGLDGLCVTEHDKTWRKNDIERLAGESGLVVIGGLEVTTNFGDFLLFGLDEGNVFSGLPEVSELKRVTDRAGGFLVAAHPFRKLFDWEQFGKPVPSVEDVLRYDMLQHVDDIEAFNGKCSHRENNFALEVANRLGRPGIGGSDAHSRQEVGWFVTVFEADVSTEEEFLEELRRGHYYPATGLREGRLVRLPHSSSKPQQSP